MKADAHPPGKHAGLRPAALLDRDGTIMVDHGYVGRADQVELLPRVADGLKVLAGAGLALVVVTNQSGIGRGYFGMDAVDAVNARLADLLRKEGVELAGFFICPHRPESGCECRKPGPGLARRAAAELGLDLPASIVIGDKESDVELGFAVGAFTVLLAPGGTESDADVVAPDWANLIPALRDWCDARRRAPRAKVEGAGAVST